MQAMSQVAGKERRKQRSDDPHTALSLQLSQLKREGKFDAVALATSEGLLIAHAGDVLECSELAAVAPLISSEHSVPERINLGKGLLHVHAVPWAGSPLYLAATSNTEAVVTAPQVTTKLEAAEKGVARILSN